jgi:hypothetical protein
VAQFESAQGSTQYRSFASQLINHLKKITVTQASKSKNLAENLYCYEQSGAELPIIHMVVMLEYNNSVCQ